MSAPLALVDPGADTPVDDGAAALLTRKQASEFLATLDVKLAPATLAWLWSRGRGGPPCEHIRGKPWYPRETLRRWAAEQRSGLRTAPEKDGASSAAPTP